ncbi:CHAT domain-containing protein [Corallococcus llansteffanensis]|nr:CHAT domain-containing protein [Corallococcus llansteffanensis]
MPPEETAPYSLTIEVARAEGAGDPHAFRCMRQDYVFRSTKGFGSAEFPWDEQVLGAMAQLLRPRPEPGALQHLGERLRTFLEQGLSTHEGWAHHELALLQAVEAGRPVYLTFRFGAAELYSLPWELVALRTTGQHLGELPGCLVQYEWPGVHPAPLPSRRLPGSDRVLFGWSAAAGEVPWREHREALTQASRGHRYGFEPEKDVVARLSLTALEQHLREAVEAKRPVTALHLLCHGTRQAGGTSGLVWDGAQGEPEVVDAAALRRVLAPHAGWLRLVVLCACYGGHAGAPGNALGSVAQGLHRVGLEAVVSSRLPLSVAGSVRLTESFYANWQGPPSVRPALLEARRALLRTGGLEWASLQLFSPLEPPRAASLLRRRLLLGLGATAAGLLTTSAVRAMPRVQPLGGQVLDEEGRALMGARVTLLLSQRDDALRVETDEQGLFHLELRAEREAEVRFRVEKEGYLPFESTATLGNTGLGFSLEREP